MATAAQDGWVSRVLGVSPGTVPDIAPGTASGTAPGAGSPGGNRAAAVRLAASTPIRMARAAPPVMRHVSVEGRQVWQAARDAVAEQIGPLQEELLADGDPALGQVANRACPALMARLGTGMLAAMIEVDGAPPEGAEAARARARAAVAAQRGVIAADPLIRMLENNDKGVAVDIRGTLGAALDQIERALAS